MPRKSLSIVSKRLPKEKSWETLSLPLTKSKVLVVSTIISGVLFARFSTVDCVPTVCSFLVTSLTAEARNEREIWLFAPLLMHFVSNTLCSCLQHIQKVCNTHKKRVTFLFIIPWYWEIFFTFWYDCMCCRINSYCVVANKCNFWESVRGK